MDQLTFLSEAPRANPTASREKDLAWMTRAATSLLNLLPWAYEVMPSGWYSKTYRGYCQAVMTATGDRPARTSQSSSLPPLDATTSRRQRAGETLASRPAGEDFAIFLSAATGCHYEPPPEGWGNAGIATGRRGRYGIAWRVLDAQYFGVPQKRRRLFVVGYLGDWRRAAAVLLEPESLQGNPEPSRKARQGYTRPIAGGINGEVFTARMTGFGKYEDDDRASTLKARDHKDATDLIITIPIHEQALRDSGGGTGRGGDGLGNGLGIGKIGDPSSTLLTNDKHSVFIASVALRGRDGGNMPEMGDDKAFTLRTAGGGSSHGFVLNNGIIRKYTPVERERLMGFPDNYTLVDGMTDSQRTMLTGNSMAVPVIRWIGERIEAVNRCS